MRHFIFALCLVAFVIGFGLQIRDYRRKPEQDKTMALVGLTLTALSFALIFTGTLLDGAWRSSNEGGFNRSTHH